MAERESSWCPATAPLVPPSTHCYGISPLKGLPKVTGSLCTAMQLPLGWTVRQHCRNQARAMNTPMGTTVHKAVSQTLWCSHKIRAKNCQGITAAGISGFTTGLLILHLSLPSCHTMSEILKATAVCFSTSRVSCRLPTDQAKSYLF